MIIGNVGIQRMIEAGQIMNAHVDNIGPASLDMRLGTTFLFPKGGQEVMLGGSVQYETIESFIGKTVWLPPGAFCLATTMEYIDLPIDLAGYMQGRSSIGRAGLTVENAGFVDPGFEGCITLELKNESPYPIGLRPGYPVVQIVFEQCTEIDRGYTGKYNGQIEATGSRMYLDERKDNATD